MTQAQSRPADFDANAALMRNDKLAKLYRVGTLRIAAWREESGVIPPPRQERVGIAMPDDFIEAAPTMTLTEAMSHYGVAKQVIYRWRKEAAVQSAAVDRRRPMPGDFRERYADMSVINLAKHYRASREVVIRWAREAGVCRPAGVRITKPKPKAFIRAIAEKRAATARLPSFGGVERSTRDTSHAGQAADFLRRFSAVVRCDATGRYNATGTHYRRGSAVLTGEEVIARAERLGFDPNAWARLAA